MKNKFKYLLLLIIILMTAGCSGNYNLKINADLSIDEKLELSIDNEDNLYEKTLKIFEENNINKDKYDVSISSGKILIEYNDKYSSVEDYILNSKIYPQLFNKIEYHKTRKYIDLYTKENLKIKNNYNVENGTNLTDFDVLQVNIENPFNVNYSNSDIVSDNIYTWSIKKDDINKTIRMQFKPNFNKFPIKPVVVGSLIIIISAILIFNLIRKYKKSQRI